MAIPAGHATVLSLPEVWRRLLRKAATQLAENYFVSMDSVAC
jgi:hypothetical protein